MGIGSHTLLESHTLLSETLLSSQKKYEKFSLTTPHRGLFPVPDRDCQKSPLLAISGHATRNIQEDRSVNWISSAIPVVAFSSQKSGDRPVEKRQRNV